MLFNTRGGIVRADEPRTCSREALGAPRFGWKRLDLAAALSTADPGSRLASAITDGGETSGVVFPLNGSWGSNDWTGAYPYIIWPLEDVHGRPLGGDVDISVSLYVRLRGSFAATDEFTIGMALVNESALTGSTVDGKGVTITGTGAGGAGVLASGSATSPNGTGALANGTMTSGTVGAVCDVGYHGLTTGRIFTGGTIGLDSSGVSVGGTGTASTTAITTSPPSRWYLAAFAGRLSAGNANAKSPAADFYVSPNLWRYLVAPQ